MKKAAESKTIADKDRKLLFETLEARFVKNMPRHKGMTWSKVLARLEQQPGKWRTLYEMENSGGEPDVVAINAKTGEYLFYDCSPESPSGRRSLCFDREGWTSRKEARPENTAMDLAEEMGVGLLNEEEYRFLQTLGTFDAKTSSWIATPADVRKLGGALFADHRYGRVFVYHNGAQSYYAARGFRGSLNV